MDATKENHAVTRFGWTGGNGIASKAGDVGTRKITRRGPAPNGASDTSRSEQSQSRGQEEPLASLDAGVRSTPLPDTLPHPQATPWNPLCISCQWSPATPQYDLCRVVASSMLDHSDWDRELGAKARGKAWDIKAKCAQAPAPRSPSLAFHLPHVLCHVRCSGAPRTSN